MSDSPVLGLDFPAALKQYQLERVYQRILKVFVSTTPDILNRLAAWQEGNLEDYVTLVHGYKGACYGIQANLLGDLAKELEFAGKAGDTATILAKNDTLIAEANALLTRVADYLANAE
jgi:HPt (histidine-containing phosphotransfer) domain-containing protein